MKSRKIFGIILIVLGILFGTIRPFTSCRILLETLPERIGYLSTCVINSIVIGIAIVIIGIILLLKTKNKS